MFIFKKFLIDVSVSKKFAVKKNLRQYSKTSSNSLYETESSVRTFRLNLTKYTEICLKKKSNNKNHDTDKQVNETYKNWTSARNNPNNLTAINKFIYCAERTV